MDAPNAPNPANLNVQDQNADAVQGPANQVQGPMAKIRLRVPQFKTQFRVLQIKIRLRSLQVKNLLKFQQLRYQFKVPHRLVKILLSNHYNN